jgi:hypothetical protein
MKEVKIDRGFTLEELRDRVEILRVELNNLMTKQKGEYSNLSAYSLAWLRTYSYLMGLAPDIDKKTFNKLHNEMIRQRDSIESYAVFWREMEWVRS